MSTSVNFFPFQWNYEDEFNNKEFRCVIRIWGWNEKNEGVCVRVEDFDIPVWIELPVVLDNKPVVWTTEKINKIANAIQTLEEFKSKKGYAYLAPVAIQLEERKRLYNNEFFKVENNKYDSRMFTFLKVTFKSCKGVQKLADVLNKPLKLSSDDNDTIMLRCHCSSRSLTPVMKLMAIRNIPSSNWIMGLGINVHDNAKQSLKQHEYIISYKRLQAHPTPDQMPIIAPLVCSFDIETYSHDHNKFPDPSHGEDLLLQIGCIFARRGIVENKVLITLGEPIKPEGLSKEDDFELICCKHEVDLLLQLRDVILKYDPDVFIGYNIFGFDIRYLAGRAQYRQMSTDFLNFSCVPGKPAEFSQIKWESSARGVVDLQFLNAHGRLFIDLLPIIKASENLPSYKLEAVAAKHLGGLNKDPITPKQIFQSWKNQDWKTFGEVAAYCIKDTYVTYRLYEKLLMWYGLVESATTNKVPIFCMVSQGQQIKAYAQVFDYCYNNEIMCNIPPKQPKKPYKGAIVTEPIAGLYEMILPFDFASLYPTIIIAKNIDFSRFVPPTDCSIPDEICEVLRWSDHEGCGCPKDTMPKAKAKVRLDADGQPIATKPKKVVCNDYDYRFIKKEYAGPGVVPTIITNLLAARKNVRKKQEAIAEEIDAIEEQISALPENKPKTKEKLKQQIKQKKELYQVLEKRQLAFKVNANSMYGMFGAENGYLPFFPGAESVTRVGRVSIMAASERLEKVHGGKVIYNDTDSAYCYFEKMRGHSVQEIWNFAQDVVKDIATLFTAPMKLEFEGKIYVRFMIFTKKKYIAEMLDEKGKLKENMYMRGVPLVRREYCKNMKQIYEHCVKYILKRIEQLSGLSKQIKDPLNTGTVQVRLCVLEKCLQTQMSGDLRVQDLKNTICHMLSSSNLKITLFVHCLQNGKKIAETEHKTARKILDENTEETLGQLSEQFAHEGALTIHCVVHDYVELVNDIMQHFVNAMSWQTRTPDNTFNLEDFVIYKGLTKEHYSNPQAHVEVAKKITNRGTPVAVNSRIEYVLIADSDNVFRKDRKQFEISEDYGYFKQFREILRLDLLQYFKSQHINYLDQVLVTIFGVNKVASKLFAQLAHKNQTIAQIKYKFRPTYNLINASAQEQLEFKNFSTVAYHKQISKQPLTHTADKKVAFEQEVWGLPVSEWITRIYKLTNKKNKLEAGNYHYDKIAHIVYEIANSAIDEEDRRDKAHAGFVNNLRWWTDYKPWFQDIRYSFPYPKLENFTDLLSCKKASDCPASQQEWYKQIVTLMIGDKN
jgi:DNA polymerase elongation subunit (family B)